MNGSPSTQGGDFVGRDKIIFNDGNPYDVRGLPNPYIGLSAFTYADRAIFGGRERSIREAVQQLTTPGKTKTLLLITGDSGSGKNLRSPRRGSSRPWKLFTRNVTGRCARR